jgi:hypothetical protein
MLSTSVHCSICCCGVSIKWHLILRKLGKKTTETFGMLEVAFGEQTMGRTQVFE